MKTVYLCGAINGCTDAQAKDWREATKKALAGHFTCLDPMRRDFRGVEDSSVDEIVQGDLVDISQSDIVLVAADLPSWGTAMEIIYARGYGCQIIVVCGAERVSPWLRFHADYLVPTLEGAWNLLRDPPEGA